MSLTGDLAVSATSDSFWEVNGHQRVIKRAENGAQMCSELAKMLLERAEIERDYAKRLKAWSSKWTESLETGMYLCIHDLLFDASLVYLTIFPSLL